MTNRPRYVFDTNVIVSALMFPNSNPGEAFSAASKHGEIILSATAVAEISEVLRRPKFSRYVLPEERDRFLAALIREARIVAPTESIRLCRDPKDDQWLEIAIEAAASHLITGDADLLAIGNFRGREILTPAAFLEALLS